MVHVINIREGAVEVGMMADGWKKSRLGVELPHN